MYNSTHIRWTVPVLVGEYKKIDEHYPKCVRLSFELKNPLTVEIRVEFFMGFSLYRWRRNEKCPGR
jgi:hypothetical protein